MSKPPKVLILVDDGYHELELFYPWYRFLEEGYECDIASSQIKPVNGKRGKTVTPSISYNDVNIDDYCILVIPGGHAPEIIRLDEKALYIVREFFRLDKLVACICHGGQILVSARVLKDRKGTCYVSIKDDLIAAGMEYIDEPVVVDRNFISSRQPSDLPFFVKEIMKNHIKNII
ncbi:MAG: type 1 glutamine amidotransferase [Victivallaceae bacterium]|nr:type 1 glutamine amidotransferase [Victivallaceae bacterium]